MINKNKNNSYNVILNLFQNHKNNSKFNSDTPAMSVKYKKIFLYSLSVIVALFIFGDVGFADYTVSKTESSSIAEILNGLITGMGTILGLLTGFISLFLNPGWVSGSIFGLTGYLKEMWILVSNVVYFIFAGIIIAIAFMNIIGKGDNKFELKQALPKFIIGILLVPLSWFIVQLVLSISSILTVSVLTIPYDTFAPTFDKVSDKAIDGLCKKRSFRLQPLSPDTSPDEKGTTTGNELLKNNKYEAFHCDESGGYVTFKDIVSGSNGNTQNLYGIISVYTFGIMEVGTLDTLAIPQIGTIKDIFSLSAKMLFDIVFIIIYLILLIALFLALFTRGIWLWMYAMLSPLFGLMYFLGDKGGETLKKFTFQKFFGLAMVPVLVSAALSFGLLFIFVAGNGLSTNSVTGTSGEKIIDKEGLHLGFMDIKFEGEIGDTKNQDSFISALFGGALDTVGWLIIKIFGLALLWIAVMAALNASTITGEIVKPIADFGNSVGKLAMSAPKFIPIPGTGGLSASGISTVGNRAVGHFETMASNNAQKFMEKHNLFQETAGVQKIATNLKNELITAGETNNKLQASAISNMLKHDKPEQLVNNSDIISELNALGKKIVGKDFNIEQGNQVSFVKGMRDLNNEYTQKRGIRGGIGLGDNLINETDLDTWQELISRIGKSNVKSGDDYDSSSVTTSPIEITSNTAGTKVYQYMGMNIEVKDNKFAEQNDYKYLAQRLVRSSPGGVNVKDLKEMLNLMGIESEKQDDILNLLIKYIKKDKDKNVYDDSGNGNSPDFFKS